MRWIRFHYPDDQRGFATGIWMLGTKLGPAIGPPIAASMITAFGWRQMFFLLGAGLLIWLVPWLKYASDDDLHREQEPVDRHEPPFSAVLLSPTVSVIHRDVLLHVLRYFCVTWLPS